MGTKNNPKNRVKNLEKKKYQGKEVEPIFYYGVHANHGKYMSAKYAGTTHLVLDADHKPINWEQVS